VKYRAETQGVYGLCHHCNGDGSIYVEEEARLSLILWLIHPRKGASRGVAVNNIQYKDMPKILDFLREARDRNSDRFRSLK